MAQKKVKILTTPIGTAVYPYLTKPDTKFDAKGVFRVKLRLSGQDAAELKETIDKSMEESLVKAKEDNPTIKKFKVADPPYSMVTDDDGNETGEMDFSFKKNAQFTSKKTGETVEQKIRFFSAKGKEITVKGYVAGGSQIRVAFDTYKFYTALVGAGVSLRIEGIKIIDLVQGGRSAEDLGFGDEEEGYEGSPMVEYNAEDPGPTDADDPTAF